MRKHRFTVVNVTLEDREDGGLRVHSDDLPGLILSGSNRDDVWQAITPAITALLARSGVECIAVYSTKPLPEILEGSSPRDVDIHIVHGQFVVELPESEAA